MNGKIVIRLIKLGANIIILSSDSKIVKCGHLWAVYKNDEFQHVTEIIV